MEKNRGVDFYAPMSSITKFSQSPNPLLLLHNQIFLKKRLHFVIRNFAAFPVVQVAVHRPAADETFFVALFHSLAPAGFAGHLRKGIFAEIAAVSLFAVD